MLPGEADAAVELEAVADEQALAFAGLGLRERGGVGAARVVLCERERGEVAERSGALDREEHVREPVLQRLEGADRALATGAAPSRTRASARRCGGRRRPSRARAPRWRPRARAPPRARGCPGPGAMSTRSAGTVTSSSARSASGSVGSSSVRGSAFSSRPGTRNTPRPPSPRATTAISSACRAVEDARLAAGEREAAARAPRTAGDAREIPAILLRERHRAREAPRRDARKTFVRERRRPGLRAAARTASPVRNGPGVTARPSSSATRHSSTAPSPSPPCASAIATPGQAIIRRHSAARCPSRRARAPLAAARAGTAPRARAARRPAARAGRPKVPGPSARDGS